MTPGGHPLQPDYEFNLPGTNGLVLRIVAEEPGLSIAAVYDANNQKISPRLADLQIFNMKIPTMPRENKPTESHIMLLNLIHKLSRDFARTDLSRLDPGLSRRGA